MTKIRKAHVNCPKCGHGFTVRDNGGLSREEADKVWKAVEKSADQLWAASDRLFAAARRLFNS